MTKYNNSHRGCAEDMAFDNNWQIWDWVFVTITNTLDFDRNSENENIYPEIKIKWKMLKQYSQY